MSFHAMGWAARQSGLSPTHKLVLIMLAERADRDTDVAFPSYATLATDCGLSRRACINAIQWLAENGYITAERREAKGRQSSNAYRLHCELPQDRNTKPSGERGALVNEVHHQKPGVVNVVHQGGERGALPGGERGAPEPISSKPVSEPEPFEVGTTQDQDRFPEFWIAYPLKANRVKAEAEWFGAVHRAKPDTIIAGALAYAATRTGQDPKFTIQPANWLRDDRWTDQHATTAPAADQEREAKRERWRRIAASYPAAADGASR